MKIQLIKHSKYAQEQNICSGIIKLLTARGSTGDTFQMNVS